MGKKRIKSGLYKQFKSAKKYHYSNFSLDMLEQFIEKMNNDNIPKMYGKTDWQTYRKT